jgi:hypothetical protein
MCGTRSLSDILCQLVTLRGYGQLLARQILENTWNTVIGEPHCHQTQVGEIRRGILNVTVAHPSLLEELSAFRKATLLTSLQSSALGITIHDIQFQVGSVVFDSQEAEESTLALSVDVTPIGFCPPIQNERPRSEKQSRSCHDSRHNVRSRDLGD